MRVVAQIVRDAALKANGNDHSDINYGLLLLVSFTTTDNENIANKMADKVLKMRIFPDDQGKTNLDIKSIDGKIMSVSQFTLYGELSGRRPSFTKVLPGTESSKLYDIFNAALRKEVTVATGLFGANMDIRFTNEGPVTYILEINE